MSFFSRFTVHCSEEKLEAQRIQSLHVAAARDRDCESGHAGQGGPGAQCSDRFSYAHPRESMKEVESSKHQECVLPGTGKTYYSRAPALPQGSARICLHCTQPRWASRARIVQNASKWCLQVASVSTELVSWWWAGQSGHASVSSTWGERRCLC